MSAREPEIVSYRDELGPAFDELNRAWLEANGLLEAADLPYLEDPRGRILERGGAVLFAMQGATVLGTVAILRLALHTFELAKLAVAPSAQGRGLGRKLTCAAIELAASRGARRIVLSSSSRLTAALRLYEALGFRPAPPDPSAAAYDTADVHLALDLDEQHRGSRDSSTWSPPTR